MYKRHLKTLPILILLLALSVVIIIFYSIKRYNKENQVVTLVETNWKFITILNNLQNALQTHAETLAFLVHGDNKGDLALAVSSEKRVLAYLDSTKNIFKPDTELQPYIDSLTFYINKRLGLSRQIIDTGMEKGSKAAEIFFINAPASKYSDYAYSSIRKLQLKTLQKLAQDEGALTNTIKELGIILSVLRFLALILIFLIIRKFFLDFTLRKQLESKLKNYNEELQEKVAQKTNEIRQSEERYRLLIEQASDAFFVNDVNGKILDVNDNACKMTGYTREELFNMNTKDFVQYENEQQHQDVMDRLFHGERTSNERKFKRYDGTLITVESNSKMLSDGRIMAIVRDITERKQMENALKASEIKLRQVLSSYSDIFYVIDKNFQIILINEMAEKSLSKVWGKPVRLGANLLNLIPEQTDEPIVSSFENVFKGKTIEYELHVGMEGLPNWVLVTYYPVKDYDGSIVGAYIITKDISPRKKIEDELRHSINRFELISRTTNDAIWEWNLETGWLWANETHQQLYGLHIKDPVPQKEKWIERIHPEDRERILKEQEVSLASDINVTISEYRFYMEGKGYRDFYDRCYIVRDPNGKAVRLMGSMMDITERKRVETAIKESEIKYRSFFENSMDGILLTIPDGKILSANSAACKIFQMTEAEICAAGRNVLVDPDNPNLPAYLAERKKNGKVKGELVMLRKDGSKFIADFTSSVFRDATGEERTSIILRDISEQKKIARELQEAELKFRNLVEKSLVGVYIIQDGKLAYVNPRLAEMLGYEPSEMINTFPIEEMIHPDHYRMVSENINLRLQGKIKSSHYEVDFIKKSGEAINVEAFGSRTDFQEKPAIIGSVLDITHRKKAEKALRALEETRRNIMDSSMDAIVCMDTDGLITVWTPQSEKIFGWKEQDVIGKKLSDVIIPLSYRDQHEKGLVKYLKTGKHKMFNTLTEVSALRKDGTEFPVELNIVPLKQDGKEFFCGFIRDISDRKKSETEIKRAKELSDQIIDNLPGMFYLFNESGVFIRWNKQFEIISGFDLGEIADKRPWEFFEGNEVEYIRKRIHDVFIHGANDAEAHFVTKDKKRIPFYFKAIRINYQNQTCLLGFGIDISESKKAKEELEQSYLAIRKLTIHLQNIREEERTHIARDIHDELGQQLTVLKMDASWLNKKLIDADGSVKQKLRDLLELMDSTVKTVRRISSKLRPSLLDDMGLIPAMEWHLKEFERRTSLKTRARMPEEELNLPDPIKNGLFRIFQESLTNVARHANAKIVDIELRIEKGKIVMSIKDDGKGFEMTKVKEKKTLGILGMQERSYMIGGNYEIKSRPGKGTQVIVSVPYPG